MQDVRCPKCNKLLFRANFADVEIICDGCKRLTGCKRLVHVKIVTAKALILTSEEKNLTILENK